MSRVTLTECFVLGGCTGGLGGRETGSCVLVL